LEDVPSDKQGGKHVLLVKNVGCTFHFIKQGTEHVTFNKTMFGARFIW